MRESQKRPRSCVGLIRVVIFTSAVPNRPLAAAASAGTDGLKWSGVALVRQPLMDRLTGMAFDRHELARPSTRPLFSPSFSSFLEMCSYVWSSGSTVIVLPSRLSLYTAHVFRCALASGGVSSSVCDDLKVSNASRAARISSVACTISGPRHQQAWSAWNDRFVRRRPAR